MSSLRNDLIAKQSYANSLNKNTNLYLSIIALVTFFGGMVYLFIVKEANYIFYILEIIGVGSFVAIIIQTIRDQNEEKQILSFHCPSCCKFILLQDLDSFNCPACGKENNYRNIIFGCDRCKNQMPILVCPKCESDINLNNPYNESDIRKQIQQSV